MNAELVVGSLDALAQQEGKTLAETFLNVETVILVDTSASMAAHDGRDGRSRYNTALEELARLQAALPGKIALISFSSQACFCPTGRPHFYGDNTDLAGALRLAAVADLPGITFIVISDGEPDAAQAALDAAAQIKAPIHTVYVGPDDGPGRAFLRRLAEAHSGRSATAGAALNLSAKVQYLLAGGAELGL